ncbi:MAG: sugar ABC transporter permease [Candidatus Atribacteria bacterium]|nr:sugar ABC transporter permease [Candidatus Atribacteria bacterium]
MRYYKSHGIVFLIPILVIVILFYGMIIWDVFAAFTRWQGLLPTWQFSGFYNFIRLFQMDRFWVNLRNNILWLAIFIVPTVIVGFSIAYLITNFKRGETILWQIFLFPMALSFIITGVLWAWMYDPSTGVINSILKIVGVNTSRIGWIALPKTAIYCMIFSAFWQYLGFALVIYLGAIKSLPLEMVEAARVDGASHFTISFRIIFPNVGHATLISTTMLAITTVKAFDLVWIMTRGGPGVSTEILPYLMYRLTFDSRDIGMGAATSIVMLIFSSIIVIPYSLWALKKWVRI